jgi:crotonobetainyl-CoA:carnitine CoA-transferase CaiB-like acyl-CoA transferase
MAAELEKYKALGNIRVIDFTHRVAGPYCTKLLAGFGAQVIKIEPPVRGDPERAAQPLASNAATASDSISFLWLNTGKKSVTLDLKTSTGRSAALALIQGADVVIENFSPGVMRRLGLDYDALKVINPGLIMVSISNFGQSGPYRDFKAEEIQLNAISGIMDSTGSPKREPLSSGPRLNQYTAGLHAYLATVTALEQRQSSASSRGQYIDLSIMESSMEQIENRIHAYLSNGTIAKRGPHPFVPWGNFSSRDGFVTIIGAPFRHWPSGVKIFGDEWLAREELFHVRDRIEQRELINQHVQAWAEKMHKREVFELGQANGMSFGYVDDLDGAINSSQHSARQFFAGIDHPATGKQLYCDAPFKMSVTPWSTGRAPAVGEHNDSLKTAQGSHATIDSRSSTAGKAVAGVEDGHAAGQPLEGIRVIDMTHSWAGPHCSRLLADYGAEVIKIEYPRRLCFFRGARIEDHLYDKQTPWQQINRNKKSVALDLDVAADREMLQDLVRVSDVFISNSRPGVLEKLGFDYRTLAALKPDIIMLSMTAFGDTGPYAAYCAYGAVMEGVGGIQSLTRYEGDSTPQRIREMDVINGIGGAAAVVTALNYRRVAGSGQYIDFSQMEFPTHALIGEQLLQQAIDGDHASPAGNASPYFAPQGCYPCEGTDKWVTLSVRTQEEWLAFCAILAGSQVAASGAEPSPCSLHSDPRFATGEGRLANRAALDELIMQWTKNKKHIDIMLQLQAVGVPAAAVLATSELANNPHLQARGYFHAHEAGEDTGAVSPKQRMGVPFKLANTQTFARRGPNLGEHNLEVGTAVLNREHDQIPKLDESSIGTAYDYP